MIDGQVAGETRKLITHSARNGFLYTMERSNGRTVMVKPYLENINWTKGIDQKTGKPVDYDPNRDIQLYAGTATPVPGAQTKKMCPSPSGGNNFWPSTYSPKTKLIYIPALTACGQVTQDPEAQRQGQRRFPRRHLDPIERMETDLNAMDPVTGELKGKYIPYPNFSGALATAGGVVFSGFTDGTFAAYDDTTMAQLWKINVGVGFNAPPMTFEVGGKQYVAILVGLSRIAIDKHAFTPELKEQRNQPMLFVFGL